MGHVSGVPLHVLIWGDVYTAVSVCKDPQGCTEIGLLYGLDVKPPEKIKSEGEKGKAGNKAYRLFSYLHCRLLLGSVSSILKTIPNERS